MSARFDDRLRAILARTRRERRGGLAPWLLACLVIALVGGPGVRVGWAAPPSSEADSGGDGQPAAQTGEGEGEPDPGPSSSSPAAQPDEDVDPRVEVLRTRAKQVRALMDGDLDPAVAAPGLFVLDLGAPPFLGAGASELRSLFGAIQATREAQAANDRAQAEYEAARAAREALPRRRRGDPVPEPELVELPPEPPLLGPEADAVAAARAELARVYWEFLTLPADRREALLDAHAARRALIATNREAEARAEARLAQLRQDAARLEAFLAGELELDVDPASLLRVDLAGGDELGSEARLARALAQGLDGGPKAPEGAPAPGAPKGDGPSESPDTPGKGGEPPAQPPPGSPPGSPDPDSPDPDSPPAPAPGSGPAKPDPAAGLEPWAPGPALAAQIAEAEAELDRQRLRYISSSASEREALLARHAERQREAKQEPAPDELIAADVDPLAAVQEQLSVAEDKAASAKRAREQAEAAAAAARTEALRRIGEERVRLLGVKEAHANLEVDLQQGRKQIGEYHEIALRWDHEVKALAEQQPGADRAAAADAMYNDLRQALSEARDRLRETLSGIARTQSRVEPAGEPLAGLPAGIDSSDLASLRQEVEASEQELIDLEREVVWTAADQGRDDIVMLNQARLELLELASDDLRSRMTDFGSDGVAQVRREIDQIGLELRYRVLALPRLARGLLSQLESAPLPVIGTVVKLALFFIAFRYWRRRAETTLDGWRDAIHDRERGSPRVNAAIAVGIWYIERIRKPVELLTLFFLVFRFGLPSDAEALELQVVWLVVLWLLVGSTVILLVDAIAAHENMVYGRGSNATAKLRILSLRLVGLTVVITGLVLSVTEEVVGQGAIYNWVLSIVWVPAIAVLLVLIRWWREHAFRRIQSDPEIPDNAVIRWIRASNEGLASFPAAALAGGYLFGRGLVRWLLVRANSLEITRRMLAWMFRREVARQASEREKDQIPVKPLSDEDYADFDPAAPAKVEALSVDMQPIARGLLDEVIALKVSHRGTLSAVIGERGAGKSTFLRRLERELLIKAEEYEHVAGRGEDVPDEDERHDEYGKLSIRRIQCPPGGFRPLQRAIAESVGLARNTPREQLIEALSEQTPLVFLIDDAHRLVRPAIGGLAGLDAFADFAREVSGDASWIASIGAAAWQYVSRARGERVFFDQVLQLPRWDETQIGALIRERSAETDLDPSFAEIVIPRQFDVAALGDPDEMSERPSPLKRAELGFYRILWDYAKGNPAVALHFWRESLRVVAKAKVSGGVAEDGAEDGAEGADGAEQVVVRLFKEPPAKDLDEVGPTLQFVLRGVVQLEIASPSDLVACTQLPPADVADALRFALARGWVVRVGSGSEHFSVTWHWYRAITDMLRRQHLLAI